MNQNKKTLYIIGAGASFDWKFPVGNQLKTKISQMYTYIPSKGGFTDAGVNREYNNLVRRSKRAEAKNMVEEASALQSGMPLSFSIDNYLDAHSDNETLTYLGKLGIVRTILNIESKSKLTTTSSGKLSMAIQHKCWHTLLFQSLVENCSFPDFKERLKNVSFIIFNYDRVLEQYLFIATKIYYRESDEEVSNALNMIKFIHPYGQCGRLPWQTVSGTEVSFGDFDNEYINRDSELLEEIYTFTDKRSKATDNQKEAHNAILHADRIVILGFAFHPMNMQWLDASVTYNNLKPDIGSELYVKSPIRKVYSSALGIAESDRSVVMSMCAKAFRIKNNYGSLRDQVFFSGEDDDCSAFMSQFSLSIGYGEILL